MFPEQIKRKSILANDTRKRWGFFLWKTQQQQRPTIRKTHKEIDKAAGNSIVVRKHTNQSFICISMLYP